MSARGIALALVLVGALASSAPAAAQQNGTPTPAPLIVSPQSSVTVRPPTGPAGVPPAVLDAARAAIEDLLRARPELILAPLPGVVLLGQPLPPPALHSYVIDVRIQALTRVGPNRLRARLEMTLGELRAGTLAVVAAGSATAMFSSGALRFVLADAQRETVQAATRSAYRGLARMLVP